MGERLAIKCSLGQIGLLKFADKAPPFGACVLLVVRAARRVRGCPRRSLSAGKPVQRDSPGRPGVHCAGRPFICIEVFRCLSHSKPGHLTTSWLSSPTPWLLTRRASAINFATISVRLPRTTCAYLNRLENALRDFHLAVRLLKANASPAVLSAIEGLTNSRRGQSPFCAGAGQTGRPA